MVENENESSEPKSETLFKKLIPKMNKAGSMQVGSMTVEVKTYDGSKFIQLTQVKEAFGDRPQKKTWITMNPDDKEIKEALSEAYKK